MNWIRAVAFGVAVLVGATTAYAQAQDPEMPGVGHVTGTGPTGIGSRQDDRQLPPLFTFGGLDVRIWTPVGPPYNARANGNLAERPIGGAGYLRGMEWQS